MQALLLVLAFALCQLGWAFHHLPHRRSARHRCAAPRPPYVICRAQDPYVVNAAQAWAQLRRMQEKRVGNCTVLQLDAPTFFPGLSVSATQLIIRDCYKGIYARMNKFLSNSGRCCVLLGNPEDAGVMVLCIFTSTASLHVIFCFDADQHTIMAHLHVAWIGKSVMLHYIMWLAAHEGGTVVYDRFENVGEAIMFTPTQVCKGPLHAFAKALGQRDTWYLVDGKDPGKFEFARTVLATSPDWDIWKTEVLERLKRYNGDIRCVLEKPATGVDTLDALQSAITVCSIKEARHALSISNASYITEISQRVAMIKPTQDYEYFTMGLLSEWGLVDLHRQSQVTLEHLYFVTTSDRYKGFPMQQLRLTDDKEVNDEARRIFAGMKQHVVEVDVATYVKDNYTRRT
ncbi:hypothetical protein JKP88DRAFT_326505 [Tribonema minus]|uniref:Uncharacterized protein n=1 Tax=Tribonema minus TaxID=303371 RepID=A0A835YYJ3_9STRA|nr:hypothetical protein JKP88DRAFT_326505 [Tribonema minus]